MVQSLVQYGFNQKKDLFSEPELHHHFTIAFQKPVQKSIQFFENSPNPFSSITTVRFSVNRQEYVTIRVINPLGREICVLFSKVAAPNKIYTVDFDGIRLPSAVYFCLIHTRTERSIIRMVLQK